MRTPLKRAWALMSAALIAQGAIAAPTWQLTEVATVVLPPPSSGTVCSAYDATV